MATAPKTTNNGTDQKFTIDLGSEFNKFLKENDIKDIDLKSKIQNQKKPVDKFIEGVERQIYYVEKEINPNIAKIEKFESKPKKDGSQSAAPRTWFTKTGEKYNTVIKFVNKPIDGLHMRGGFSLELLKAYYQKIIEAAKEGKLTSILDKMAQEDSEKRLEARQNKSEK